MRIMVIGPTDKDSFADNVADAASSLGHEVRIAGPARRVGGPRRARNAIHVASDHLPTLDQHRQRHLISSATQWKPDLILTLDNRIRPDIVSELRERTERIALWFPDHVSNMGNHQMFLAPYDRVYLTNPLLVEQLKRLYGLPVGYLPEAANPNWHRPQGTYGQDRFIVVAGNVHATRAVLLERLLNEGVPLKIFGPPMSHWLDFPGVRAAHTGKTVVRNEKARTFRAARGVLNNLHPAEYAGSNCRLFEAAACGAAVLTEWRSGMDDLFDRRTELCVFSSFGELLEQCQRLLGDDDQGREVANAASARALRDHTYQRRLEQVFADLHLT